MSNILGNRLRVMVYGQSHAPSIGAVIEGLPAGFTPDWEQVRAFMARRAPGGSELSTARREADAFEILSGLNERGETCGAPLAMRIENGDARPQEYAQLRDIPRPGHADFPAAVKFSGANDIRGGGPFSGRLTAPLCFAGALALQLLAQRGVTVKAHIAELANVRDTQLDAVSPALSAICAGEISVVDPAAGAEMRNAILAAKAEGDSVGGVVACYTTGVPAGLGDPMFDGVENRLARAIFGIPGVRGIAFGTGFEAARMRGSEHNDAFCMQAGQVVTQTNRHGGILGGMTSGMPIVVRTAIKPTPSIAMEQQSVSLSKGENAALLVSGRHDPCIVPRALPCVEAAVALTLLDLMMEE